jgi:hypothetical protein
MMRDVQLAGAWLARHGLGDTRPTPALATRLAVRRLADVAVDRRAAAGLVRRATHPVPPGWRTVVGVPQLTFVVASTGGALALAASALTVDDAEVRYGAVALLIGLTGVAAGIAVRIWHLLTRPVVADGEDTLTADLVMRIEDAVAAARHAMAAR